VVSLPLPPLWTCTVAGESAGNSVSYYHIHFFFSTFLTPHPNRRFLAGKGTFNRRFLAGKGTLNGRLLAGKGAIYGRFLARKGTLNKYRISMAIPSFR